MQARIARALPDSRPLLHRMGLIQGEASLHLYRRTFGSPCTSSFRTYILLPFVQICKERSSLRLRKASLFARILRLLSRRYLLDLLLEHFLLEIKLQSTWPCQHFLFDCNSTGYFLHFPCLDLEPPAWTSPKCVLCKFS